MRIGAVADPGERPTGSTVRATQSPAARPVAMTGLVMPWSGADRCYQLWLSRPRSFVVHPADDPKAWFGPETS